MSFAKGPIRPGSRLYVVTAGDLGTTAEVVEERLSKVLELCTEPLRIGCVWAAFMLLAFGYAHGGIEHAMACLTLVKST